MIWLTLISFFILCSLQQPVDSSDESELYRIQLVPGKDLVLHENSNPCTELNNYCRQLLNSTPARKCLQKYQSKVLSEILAFSDMMKLMEVDERLFMSCDKVLPSVYNTNNTTEDGHQFGPFHAELLQILDVPSGTKETKEALELFDLRRTETKMQPHEELDLYGKAIKLHPNSSYIISKYGQMLMSHGYVPLARSLFRNAVKRGIWPSVMQRPEKYWVPQADPKPYFDPKDYPFTAIVEAGHETIRRELLANLQRQKIMFAEEVTNKAAVEFNDWKVLYLKHPGASNFTSYSKFFPGTVEIVQNCSMDFISVVFSSIHPGTHIKPHTGPSNDRLRAHLTVLHSGGARIRVGREWRTWEEGKILIFDSSWEHEVYHEGHEPRVVLMLDFWRSD